MELARSHNRICTQWNLHDRICPIEPVRLHDRICKRWNSPNEISIMKPLDRIRRIKSTLSSQSTPVKVFQSMKSDQRKNTTQGQCIRTLSKMATANESDTRKVCANVAATADVIVIAKRRAEKRANANEPAKRRADGNTRRADANVTATTSKPTKKRADAKIMATTNKMATTNINKPANNTKRAHANVVATADANVMAATNKVTSNARKAHANVTARSNGSNARRAHINKTATVNEGNTRSAC